MQGKYGLAQVCDDEEVVGGGLDVDEVDMPGEREVVGPLDEPMVEADWDEFFAKALPEYLDLEDSPPPLADPPPLEDPPPHLPPPPEDPPPLEEPPPHLPEPEIPPLAPAEDLETLIIGQSLGPFRITPKRNVNGEPVAWQAACAYHKLNEHTGCKVVFKPANYTLVERNRTIRHMMWWLITGVDYNRQRHHLQYEPTDEEIPDMDTMLAMMPDARPEPIEIFDDVELDEIDGIAPDPTRGRGGRGRGRGRGRRGGR